jgi:N-acetylmuramoyl-L-alanine amidase
MRACSSFEGEREINSCSIGIELVNKGHAYDGYAGGYVDFPELQMQSLIKLCKEILVRYDMKPWHVVAHSDVAPLRKIDPGEKFDWQRLSAEGIGVWPKTEIEILDKDAKDKLMLKDKLQLWGYDYLAEQKEITASISAFQRHFRPQNFSGEIDHETMEILDNLLLQKQSKA